MDYQFWLSIAVAPICVLVCLIAGEPLAGPRRLVLYSLACGLLWTFGSLSYCAAVDNLGVARSTPIKNLAPVFAAMYGILIFREYTLRSPLSLAMALGGVALMALGALIIGRVSAMENERAMAFRSGRSAAEKRTSFLTGILFSLSAAFFYGAYSVPLKYVFSQRMGAYTACAWLGIGVFLSTYMIYLFKERRFAPAFPGKREIQIAQTAGAIWTAGQILGALAMLYIPMSISWPISNISTLVAVGWGVWVFKEIHIGRHMRDVIASLVVYFVGLALLAGAAPGGHV